jgi:glycosyltransferase involved in cell wall biosynthesis
LSPSALRRAKPGPSAESAEVRPVVALVVDAVFPYHLGGREVRYDEITRRLADTADVHVYTMRWWPGARVIKEGRVTFHSICRLHPMYVNGRRAISQAFWFSLGCIRLLIERFDVLDADHMPYFHILVLRVIASARRRRFVVTWHEVWGPDYWREYLGWLGRGAWLVEWLAMRLPDHIVAASPETAERLQAILGPRASITVAPNGVNLDVIHATDPDTASTDLVVVGRLISHKRVEMLLDAMVLLHSAGLTVTCRIIGDGPDREALHRHAEVQGLAQFVDFRHDVREPKEMYALVKAAKVAVFPSAREGFGAAMLEALACGVQVVTTSSPDNLAQYLATQSTRGHVCKPSAAAIADEVGHLLAEPSRESAQDQDRWLVDHTWDAVAKKVTEALRI